MKWILAALGAAMVAVAVLLPWFYAYTLDGSAVMPAWGRWSTHGAMDARLAPIPVGLLLCVPTIWMVVTAVRNRFGAAFLGGAITTVLAILVITLNERIAASSPGGDAVFVDVGAAPMIMLGLALAATICAWYLFARTDLRDPPTA